MPAYLTVTYEYASADDVIDGFPGIDATGHTCEPVSDTPPVVLSGLVKGGEYASAEEWCDDTGLLDVLAVSADGRIVSDYNQACEAEARGALPITWYRYETP